jgi:nitrate reductase gamma subunit
MDNISHYWDKVLFEVLPYLALFTLILVTIQRYRAQRFTYSSLSSQFLENEQHFWGLVPFHFGILGIVAGHVIAVLIPAEIVAWNSNPLRLYVLETTALIFGFLTLIGLAACILRRISNARLRVVTSVSDWIIYALLLVQIFSGIYIAVFYRWGSSWFATSAAPYLWSLVLLNPEISYMQSLPHMVKLHIVTAYLIIGFFPFTRLVHILVIPNPYLWRKPQVVRWNRKGTSVGRIANPSYERSS